MKILIMGLPGSGKKLLAETLAQHLKCVHFNADDIRSNINKDLGFSSSDRVEQARRMGHLCDIAAKWGANVIADFVCPTEETRAAFGADFVIWIDRIAKSSFEDTNKLFVPPTNFNVRITAKFDNCFPTYHAQELARRLAIREPRPRYELPYEASLLDRVEKNLGRF